MTTESAVEAVREIRVLARLAGQWEAGGAYLTSSQVDDIIAAIDFVVARLARLTAERDAAITMARLRTEDVASGFSEIVHLTRYLTEARARIKTLEAEKADMAERWEAGWRWTQYLEAIHVATAPEGGGT